MNDPQPPAKFELYINASALKKTYCTRAYQLFCMQGHSPKAKMNNLIFGKGMHLFAARRSVGFDFEDARKEAYNHYMEAVAPDFSEADKFVGAMASFSPDMFGTLLTPEDPRQSVERYFKVNVHETDTYAIFLVGTIDRLCLIDGNLVAVDYKTSRKWKLQDIVDGYTTSVQFIFYYYICTHYPQILIPERFHGLIEQRKFFVCPCPVMLSNKPSPRWARGPMLRFDEQLPEFVQELQATISLAASMYEAGLGTDLAPLAAPSGMVADACPKCDFKPVCFRPPDVEPSAVLSVLYNKTPYDPSKF